MKYIALSVKYMFKNFHKLLAYVILPAVLFGLTSDFGAFIDKVVFLSRGDSISVMEIYASISVIANGMWYLMPVAIALFVLCLGSLMAAIDRHMRIGKFSFKFYKYFYETVRICLPILLLFIGITELLCFLTASLIGLFGLIVPITAMSGVAIGLCVVMFFVWILLFVLSVNWVPCCLVQGYSIGEGLSASLRAAGRKFGKFLLAMLFPFAVLLPIAFVSGFFFGHYAIFIYVASYILLFMYFTSLIMASYFDINEYERKDIKISLFKRF